MNKEIKEIIDIINKNYEDYIENYLSSEDVKKLVDYITNLQEEIEDLKVDYGSKAQVERDISQDKIDKALKKINNMFDIGDANTIIDDLLELEKTLKGEDNE